MTPPSMPRTDVVEAAHVLSRLELVTAFGHVSARAGASMLITPAADLATVSESALVEVPLDASSLPAATTTSLAPLHGQAAWLGESVPVHDSAHLLRSAELAERAARSLPAGEALLLRGNGALTLGATPGVAVARMWLLSGACDAFVATRAAGRVQPQPLTAEEIASWRAVGEELLPRLWQHLRRHGTREGRPWRHWDRVEVDSSVKEEPSWRLG